MPCHPTATPQQLREALGLGDSQQTQFADTQLEPDSSLESESGLDGAILDVDSPEAREVKAGLRAASCWLDVVVDSASSMKQITYLASSKARGQR